MDLALFAQQVSNGSVFGEYTVAVLAFLASLLILKIFQKVILYRLGKIAEKTENKIDDAVIVAMNSIGWTFYVTVSFYLAMQFLVLPTLLDTLVTYLTYLVVIYYIAQGVNKAFDYGFEQYVKREKSLDKNFDPSVPEILLKVLKGSLWLVALLLFLQNLGYQVSALIAGLGVGGIAIAFAIQNVLADIFAYFTISFDKPFKVGDYVMVGTDMGEVRKIGLKSTRIQTFQGEELIVSNRDLTNSRVRNYKNMESRRLVFELKFSYKTPAAKLEKVPKILKSAIGNLKLIEFERAYVKSLSGSAIAYEVSYIIKSRKYKDYVSIQNDLNIAIKKEIDKEKISLV